MQNGSSRFGKPRRHRPAGTFRAQSDRKPVNLVGRSSANDQSAKRHYERYLELALAEARSGNTIAAENYYQHAEHYYRTMREPNL